MGSLELKRLVNQLTKEVLWLYILSILSKTNTHAYVLRKKILEKFGFLPGNVTAYVVLYKLESRGFVSSKKEQNKKVYSITIKGKKLFKEAKEVFKKKQEMIFS